MVKNPEEHKKEIRLRGVQGIVLMLGGLNWHLVCWDEGPSREKNNDKAPLIAQRRYTKGWYRPCVGWLEWVLGVPLALDVLGWRTSKERNNAEKGMCIAGKLVPMR